MISEGTVFTLEVQHLGRIICWESTRFTSLSTSSHYNCVMSHSLVSTQLLSFTIVLNVIVKNDHEDCKKKKKKKRFEHHKNFLTFMLITAHFVSLSKLLTVGFLVSFEMLENFPPSLRKLNESWLVHGAGSRLIGSATFTFRYCFTRNPVSWAGRHSGRAEVELSDVVRQQVRPN